MFSRWEVARIVFDQMSATAVLCFSIALLIGVPSTSFQAAASMYVRLKRQKTIVFLYVEPSDTIARVKSKVQTLIEVPADHQQLYKDVAAPALENDSSLAEAGIETDDVLVLALRSPDGSWETPEIGEMDDGGQGDGD
jgi:hypothetical protein